MQHSIPPTAYRVRLATESNKSKLSESRGEDGFLLAKGSQILQFSYGLRKGCDQHTGSWYFICHSGTNVESEETIAVLSTYSVRNGLGAREAPWGNCEEDWTGPDDNFYDSPSRPGIFQDSRVKQGPRAPQGETQLCLPNKRTTGDGNGLQSP